MNLITNFIDISLIPKYNSFKKWVAKNIRGKSMQNEKILFCQIYEGCGYDQLVAPKRECMR